MSATAFQTQYRQEFVKGFEQRQSLLRDSVTTEAVIKGNTATFLVVDSGGANAVTRGADGLIPGRADNKTQNSCTLAEWHDKPQLTGFNIFAGQGDQRALLQQTSMAVINRKIDEEILSALSGATITTGAAAVASIGMVTKAKATLGKAKVSSDGQIYAAVSPGFMSYLAQAKEFANADYVQKKPFEGDDPAFKDMPGFYRWFNVNWIEMPSLANAGSENCYMFHRSAIGHAINKSGIETYVDYNGEHDFSYARCTAYMGAKLLQNSGIVKMVHDGSAAYGS